MRYPWILGLAAVAACSSSDPAALGRLEAGDGTAGAAGGGEMAAAGAGGAATTDGGNDALKRWLPGDDPVDAGPDVLAVPTGQIQATWTFISCGDNPITIGVVDQTTNKGLAGPVTIPRRVNGNINSAVKVTFSCAPGDIVCWSASTGATVCGSCVDGAKPDVGC